MRTDQFLRAFRCALLLLLLCVPVASARQHPIQTPPPARIKQIKLEQFGWQPPVPPRPGELDSIESQGITIDTQDRVLVGFTTRATREGLATRSNPGLLFHVVRFTADGQSDLSLELPTNNWLGNGIYLDDRDRIIVRANDKLQMLVPTESGDSDKGSWKVLAPCGPHCNIAQSHSRGTLRLDSFVHSWDSDLSVTILDLRDPSNVRQCSEPVGPPVSITDGFAYSNYDRGPPPFPPPVMYRWPLCGFGQRAALPLTVHGLVMAISDHSLLNVDFVGESIYDPSGIKERTCAFHKSVSKHEVGGPRDIRGDWAVNKTGSRIAVLADTLHGGSRRFDITPRLTAQRVIFFDMVTCEALASTPIYPYSYFIRMAMSPSGDRIATFVNDTVTIADLP